MRKFLTISLMALLAVLSSCSKKGYREMGLDERPVVQEGQTARKSYANPVIKNNCPYCQGEGVVRDEEVITIQIPAGVQGGMQIPVQGKGNAAPHGGVPGDLLVLIEEEEHPNLIREGNDLVYNLLLDMPTAVLGGQVMIPTLTGDAKITITPGTQPGKVLRMRGKGLPIIDQYARRYGQGDLLINVGVYIPEKLNKDERAMIEKLKNSDNVRPGAADKNNFFKNLFG